LGVGFGVAFGVAAGLGAGVAGVAAGVAASSDEAALGVEVAPSTPPPEPCGRMKIAAVTISSATNNTAVSAWTTRGPRRRRKRGRDIP
jgi:hypothetical protein